MLSYLPEKLLAEADLVNEARVEDELSAVPHAFGATESCQLLSEVRRNIIENASCRLDELGGELLPVTSHEAGGQAGWNRLMMPAVEFPPDHLPDELLGADKVTRVRDKRGDSWVAWFPKRLKGYVSGSVPGRKEPVQKHARSLWYSTRVYGVRRAEQLAKRHLRRAETRRSLWQRLDEHFDVPQLDALDSTSSILNLEYVVSSHPAKPRGARRTHIRRMKLQRRLGRMRPRSASVRHTNSHPKCSYLTCSVAFRPCVLAP